MTKDRIYATLDYQNDIKYISFYDAENERNRQIDVKGQKHDDLLPHTHMGYEHDEYGTRPLSPKEQKLVDRILENWAKKRKKLGL